MAIINEKNSKRKKHKTDSDIGVLNEKNIVKDIKERKKTSKVINSFAEIFPINDIAEYDLFEMKNGEYMEIVQITSKDIYSLNETDKDKDIFSLAYFYQAYLPDIKIIPLHTPVNLEVQKNHVLKNISNASDEKYIPFLEKKLAELEFIEEYRTNKEFFFFLYGETTKEVMIKKSQIKKLLIQSNPIIDIDLDKKINVLFQISNLNTKPTVE